MTESDNNFRDKNITPMVGRTALAPELPMHERALEPPGLLVQYTHLLARWRWKILGCALAGGLLGLLITLPKTPVFRAHISLEIQGLNGNFMNLRNVDTTDAAQSSSADSYIQTQIKLLQSTSLSHRVVKKLSEGGGHPLNAHADLLTIWRHQWHLPFAPPPTRAALLGATARSLKVKPLGLTRLVEATCDSSDPGMAADFCNTLAEEYIAQDLELRSENATKTGEWLTKQLADMREKLELSEQRLQNFIQVNSMSTNQSTESVSQEKLRQLQAALSQAQADRMAKEAQNESLKLGNPASVPAVLDNGPLKGYEAKLADLRRQYSELSTTLTPENPKLVKLQAQIDQVWDAASKEQLAVLGRLKNEFETATHREALLGAAYAAQEKIVAGQDAKTTELQMLKREVDSGRQIYETLWQRVKEAGLMSVLRASPVRIVDPALPEPLPIEPNPVTSSINGLIAGAVLGISYASLRERLKRKLRAPGESRTFLQVRELGVIPVSRIDAQVRSKTRSLELITWHHQHSLLAESFRATMNSLLDFRGRDESARALVISSPNSKDGKSTIVCNLGIAFAETGRRVVIVDGDLRRPRLHQVFEQKNDYGFSNLLASDISLAKCDSDLLAKPTSVPGLSVLTSGNATENISSLLHSRRMNDLVDRLRGEFDMVLFDTPPMLHLADARVMARVADGVILVLHSGVDADDAEHCSRVLREVGTPVLGVVLNHFNPIRGEAGFGYYRAYQPKGRGNRDTAAMRQV